MLLITNGYECAQTLLVGTGCFSGLFLGIVRIYGEATGMLMGKAKHCPAPPALTDSCAAMESWELNSYKSLRKRQSTLYLFCMQLFLLLLFVSSLITVEIPLLPGRRQQCEDSKHRPYR